MAQMNRTSIETRDLFEEMTDADLCCLIHDAQEFATRNCTPQIIETSLLVALTVAEAELAQREAEYARIDAQLLAERDEMARQAAVAARHEAECMRHFWERVEAWECPF